MVDERSDVLTGNLVGDLSRSVKMIERKFSQFEAERLADLERQQRPITVDQVKDLLEHYHQLNTSLLTKQTQEFIKRVEKIEDSVALIKKKFEQISSTLNPAADSFDTASHMRPRLRPRGRRIKRHDSQSRWSKASSGVWSECEDIDFSTEFGNEQVIYETQGDTP